MNNIDLEELKKELELKILNANVNTDMLIGRLKFMDLKSKKSSQYVDSKYLPVYYHLSKFIRPEKIVQMGLDLGFSLCCFLKGCDTVKEILAFQNKEKDDDSFYSERLAFSNIRDIKKDVSLYFHRGKIFDEVFESYLNLKKWDCFFIKEKYGKFDAAKEELDISWNHLNDDGFIILDGIIHPKLNKLFKNFCKIKNVQGIELKTRYGLGIIRK